MRKNNRRCRINILMVFCLFLSIVLSVQSFTVQAASNSSSNEMIYGADIGFLSQLESQGLLYMAKRANDLGKKWMVIIVKL